MQMTTPTTSSQVIEELAEELTKNSELKEMLIESLKQAKSTAQAQLDPDLYKALLWPEDSFTYLAYLKMYSQWAPRQSTEPAWQGTNGSQEVYDRLCHFYWLIDQPVGSNKKFVENIPWFSKWLVTYANAWGSFLNTTESFNQTILESFLNDSPAYRVQDSMIGKNTFQPYRPNAPSGWLTFNQFFARELNPGLRPIASPCDNLIVTSPADCAFKAEYPIDSNSTIPEITIKNTHKYASIPLLLEGSKYQSVFANGQFVHYFLSPYSYHRFHAPVSGTVCECYPVQGLVYLGVNITGNQFDAPDSSQGGYEFVQSRGIIIIDTKGSPYGDVGLVAVIPVGMAQVSSVNMTATVGSNLLKGDEFGYFLFGGSDIIVLFQEEAKAQIETRTQYRYYGSKIATCGNKS
jgi:phosphatidylserine decarboxylase